MIAKTTYLSVLNLLVMQVLLEIEDKKSAQVLSALRTLKHIKIKTIQDKKKQTFLDGLKEAIEEVNLAKAGKIKLKSAKALLDEL